VLCDVVFKMFQVLLDNPRVLCLELPYLGHDDCWHIGPKYIYLWYVDPQALMVPYCVETTKATTWVLSDCLGSENAIDWVSSMVLGQRCLLSVCCQYCLTHTKFGKKDVIAGFQISSLASIPRMI